MSQLNELTSFSVGVHRLAVCYVLDRAHPGLSRRKDHPEPAATRRVVSIARQFRRCQNEQPSEPAHVPIRLRAEVSLDNKHADHSML